MKIGILTIQSMNFGNRLQNWALQEILRGFQFEVETIQRDAGIHGALSSKVKALRRPFGRLVHRHDWVGAFYKFDKLISFSKSIVSKEFVSSNLQDQFDTFVVGSDQVWNPDFAFNSELDYLPLVDPEYKIAYAASFGVSKISTNRARTAKLLSGFKAISVREDAGANIIQDLNGGHADIVLDPTMLVSVDKWGTISTKPGIPNIDAPYLLKYVLGDDAHKNEIETIARNNGLQIIDLENRELPVGPAEFVWLIEHAQIVCIDSFHGSVFSLLFHRPFVIFERVSADADMSSRFDTLCRLFDMGHHRFCSADFDYDRCLNENWDAFEQKLASERARSLEWLKQALEGIGGRDD